MSAAEKYEGEGGPEVYDEGPLYASAAKVYPQKVSGTYRRLKWALLIICLGLYYVLPFVRWDRGPNEPHQSVLIDLPHSRFYWFFIEIWPQEVYYFTRLLILASLALFLSNALFGRVCAGHFCIENGVSSHHMKSRSTPSGCRSSRTRRGRTARSTGTAPARRG